MNPHAIKDGRSFWTYNRALAYKVSELYDGTYVDRYSMGDDRPRESMPYAVWTKGNGAMLLNWAQMAAKLANDKD